MKKRIFSLLLSLVLLLSILPTAGLAEDGAAVPTEETVIQEATPQETIKAEPTVPEEPVVPEAPTAPVEEADEGTDEIRLLALGENGDGITDGDGNQEPELNVNSEGGQAEPIASYTVTLTAGSGIASLSYQIDGGSAQSYAAPFELNAGSRLVLTAHLEAGYRFVSWADGISENPYTIESVAGAISLSPSAELETAADAHTVSFDMHGHGTQIQAQSVAHGDKAMEPYVDPYDSDGEGKWRFVRWYADEAFTDAWEFSSRAVTQDIILHAQWVPYYTVTYVLPEGFVDERGAYTPAEHVEGDGLPVPLNPSMDRMFFDGWYTDSEFLNEWDFNQDAVMQDTTLYAKFVPGYELSFNLGNYTGVIDEYEPRLYPERSLIDVPMEPSMDDAVFRGWLDQYDQFWDFENDTICEDTTLYAFWTGYYLSFDMQGHGEEIETMELDKGMCMYVPEDPAEDFYIFEGWYTEDGALWDLESDIASGDMTLYAKWTPMDLFLEKGDGEALTASDYRYEDGVLSILGSGPYTLSMNAGASQTSDRVVIESGTSLTLDGVKIDTDTGAALHIDGGAGSVALTLSGSNSLISSVSGSAGLQKDNSAMLTIGGSGSLNAQGGSNGAGIGSGNNGSASNITINSGTVTATGGSNGAGMSASDILIRGGSVVLAGGSLAINGTGTIEAPASCVINIPERPSDSGLESANIDSTWTEERLNISFVERVSKPVFSPSCEGFFTESVQVEISCAEEGASIYYTLDGATPDAASGTMYIEPIELNETTTINAIALKEGKTESMIATACYLKLPIVLMDARLGQGEPVAAQLDEMGHVLEVEAPVREGFNFGGWYTDLEFTTPWNFSDDVATSDMTLYAKWTPFTVHFDLQGHGEAIEDILVEENGFITAPEDPEERGCIFGGWFKDAECTEGNEWDFDAPITYDAILYAKWTEVDLILEGEGEEPLTESDYRYEDGVLTILGAGPYKLSMSSRVESTSDTVVISCAEGTSLSIEGVNILSESKAFLIASGAGAVALTLIGENSLSSGGSCAGLQKDNSAELTISGSGSLNAQGGVSAAGIGGGRGGNGGSITIAGGTVKAAGGDDAAGIGGGSSASGYSRIIITGGTANATGGWGAAGIGGGSGENGQCDITINDGSVTAVGGYKGAGIGGGENNASSNITIKGGTVNATGNDGAGIGGGRGGANSTAVIINGGTVNARSGDHGAGIGGGFYTSGSVTIEITGGTVNASLDNGGNNSWGAAIGRPSEGSGSTSISIAGGYVTANNATSACEANRGVGIGVSSGSGTINIGGGTVIATALGSDNTYGVGIGARTGGGSATLNIFGGHVSAKGSNMAIRATGNVTPPSGRVLNVPEKLDINGVQEVSITSQWKEKELTISFPALGAEPVFKPTGEERFEGSLTVEITCPIASAQIYYTLDESDPRGAAGILYTSPIVLTQTSTITAVAIGYGETSNLVQQSYTKKLAVTLDSQVEGEQPRIVYLDEDGILAEPEPPTREGYAFLGWYAQDATSTWNFEDVIEEDMTLTAQWQRMELVLARTDGAAPSADDYLYRDDTLSILGSGPYTLSMAEGVASTAHSVKLSSASGAMLSLEGVRIASSGNAFLIESDAGAVNINLNGDNSLSSGNNCAGLQKNNDASLTIDGYGSLYASGGQAAAGIGGGASGSGCKITINSGTVTAIGGDYASGIGGGKYGNADYITITGGTVYATGGNDAAGIGGGSSGSGINITVSGGSVTATGGTNAAGIGGGNSGAGSAITISGGSVTATAGNSAAGIGGGYNYTGDNSVRITGGTVNATGGNKASGIGGGYSVSGETVVTIEDGNVTASLAGSGNGIGGGKGGAYAVISIFGGTVIANGDQSAGVGIGADEGGANISISGGTVTANAAVGIGEKKKNAEINITGGKTTAEGSQFAILGEGSIKAQGELLISIPERPSDSRSKEVAIQTWWEDKKLTISFLEVLPAPAISPDGAEMFNGTMLVELTCEDEGASIYYTTDESTPSASSGTLYTEPIVLTETSVIKAIATKDGMLDSDVASATFTRNFTVMLDTKIDGEEPTPIYPDADGILSVPEDPRRDGYSFLYWYSDEAAPDEAWNFDAPVTKDMTLIARWQKLNLVLTRDDNEVLTESEYSYVNGVLTIMGSGPYTLRMNTGVDQTSDRVAIRSAGALTIDNVKIATSTGAALFIERLAGTVTLTLNGSNRLSSGSNCAGLQKASDAMLTIGGSGSLIAQGGSDGAGIGSAKSASASYITINNGIVTATGGNNGAGIGSGNGGSATGITINGGTVTANGGNGGAGIGSGNGGSATSIVINGGTVNANGGTGGAGIGSGHNGSASDIVVNGGAVNANGGLLGAGIGGGDKKVGSNIAIKGGAVTAKGGDSARAIGNGGNSVGEGTGNSIRPDDGYRFDVTERTDYDGNEKTDVSSWTDNKLTISFSKTLKRPLFSHPNGGEIDHSLSLELTSPDGANIYYTTDGSTPTTNSALYTEALVLKSASTIKAIAANESVSSGVVSASFTMAAVQNHDLKQHVAQAPTCTEVGWDAYESCTLCDYTTYVEIAALGHDSVQHDAKAATCTEAGWEAYETCTRCDNTTQQTIAALGHKEESIPAVEPTCTKAGMTAGKYCTVCNDVIEAQQEISALGHTEEIIPEVKSSCLEDGKTEGNRCSVCEVILVAQEAIAAHGHDRVQHEGKAASCTEAGYEPYETCTRCDYTSYVEIPPLGHSAGETWIHDAQKHWRECTLCQEQLEVAEHSYANAKDASCDICGYQRSIAQEKVTDEKLTPKRMAELLEKGKAVAGLVTDRMGIDRSYAVSSLDDADEETRTLIITVLPDELTDEIQHNLMLSSELLEALVARGYTHIRFAMAGVQLQWAIEDMPWQDNIVRIAPIKEDELSANELAAISEQQLLSPLWRVRITSQIEGEIVDTTCLIHSLQARFELQEAGAEEILHCLLVPRDGEPMSIVFECQSIEEIITDILCPLAQTPISESGLLALIH